jgi:DNA-binding transcriptional regulator YiaG
MTNSERKSILRIFLEKSRSRNDAKLLSQKLKIAEVSAANQLRSRRLMLGLPQATIAKILGISRFQIKNYETGTSRISGVRLYQLGIILQVPMELDSAGPQS